MSENTSLMNTTAVTEAPASWNTKYVTPDGFVCQLNNLIIAGDHFNHRFSSFSAHRVYRNAPHPP